MVNNFYFSNKVIYFPRKVLFSFLLLTLIMFIISPWEWPIKTQLLFYLLNILYLFAFYSGYKFGINKYKLVAKNIIFNLKKYVTVSLLISLILIYPKFLFKLKVPSAGLTEIFNAISLGIFSPSIAYAAKHQADYDGFLTLSNPLVLFYFITLPLQYFIIPLGLYFWKNLKPWQKVSYIIIVASDILSYIAIGTNKGIFDYIILLPVIALASNPNLSRWKYVLLKNFKSLFVFILILSLGIFYFSTGNQGRKNDNFGYDYSIAKFVNRGSPVLSLIPESLENTYIALDSYLTQGYYAMGLALDLDSNFTYGLGHNGFLTSLGEKILGKNFIWDKTYQVRIEANNNYSSTGKWHTAYVWMANDLTFIGVIFFVFLVGYFLGQIWLDSIYQKNPYALILLPLFFIMILYFPANNQVLGNQGSSFIFWVFFFLWYKSRGQEFIFLK